VFQLEALARRPKAKLACDKSLGLAFQRLRDVSRGSLSFSLKIGTGFFRLDTMYLSTRIPSFRRRPGGEGFGPERPSAHPRGAALLHNRSFSSPENGHSA